jgi:hypothetical protein
MSSFYTALAHVENPSDNSDLATSTGSVGPVPADVDAVRSVLLDGLRSMRGDFTTGEIAASTELDGDEDHLGHGTEVLDSMINMIMSQLEGTGERKLEGVSDSFLDGLDRVPKKALKKGMDCPICGNEFLEGE